MKKEILLVGASQMAVDYYNVLIELECNVTVVGRSEKTAAAFKESTGKEVVAGGLDLFLDTNDCQFDSAIVAVGVEQLAVTTSALINAGFKTLLVEKPAGLYEHEIKSLCVVANENNALVAIAYNRRFFASVLKAKQIIVKDGGVKSFNFEFTEWAHVFDTIEKKPGIKENLLLVNSTHVIDLAFYLGGDPKTIACFAEGELSWHKKAVFSGAGVTEANALFSYQANWNAPGRWWVEILTNNSRLILRPMEQLQIQLKGQIAINTVEIDDELDKKFKPGLFEQTKQFLTRNFSEFITLDDQVKKLDIYTRIAEGK